MGKLREDLENAAHAKQLLDNPFLKKILDDLEKRHYKSFLSAQTDEEAIQVRHIANGQSAFNTALTAAIRDGDIARQDIEAKR